MATIINPTLRGSFQIPLPVSHRKEKSLKDYLVRAKTPSREYTNQHPVNDVEGEAVTTYTNYDAEFPSFVPFMANIKTSIH